MLSIWAFEMETLILGWFVLVDTGSPLLLALFGSLRFGGTLLAPFVGVIADRFDRRDLLIVLRCGLLAVSLVFTGLAFSGLLQAWHAFILTTVTGLIRPADNVVRQSLIADSVPVRSLMNAQGLARTTQDTARILGALAGASLMSGLGIGPAYVVVSAFYLAGIAVATGINAGAGPARAARRPLADMRLGVRYMRRSPPIMAVMAMAFLVNLTAFPLTNGLLPVVARDVYGMDENGLALLVSSYAAGALAGSLLMAGLVRSGRPERVMLALVIVWHIALLAFSRTGGPGLGIPLLVLTGAVTNISMISMAVAMFSHTHRRLRGRVMGVRMLAVYGLPMGLLPAGFLAGQIGVSDTIAIYALAGLALIAVVVLKWPALVRGFPERRRGQSRVGRPVSPAGPATPA